tara:strand:+ start:1444 stop:1800 length:357 start_codon:yes stop_codon:yes gene_type:complete
MKWRNAVRVSKMRPGRAKMVTFGLKSVMIAELEGEYHATEGLCRHMRWPLAWGGKLEDGCIRCPLHQTTHRLHDGSLVEWSPFPLFPPYGRAVGKLSKKKDLPIYQTRVEGDFVQVMI